MGTGHRVARGAERPWRQVGASSPFCWPFRRSPIRRPPPRLPPPPRRETVQEVVVTANKLNNQRVLDAPISIQAISGDALRKAGRGRFPRYRQSDPRPVGRGPGPGRPQVRHPRRQLHGRLHRRRVLQRCGHQRLQRQRRRRHGARHPALRPRPHRSAARAAGHSVRRELDERHHPLHHQDAGHDQTSAAT